ncbi:hypothetical protein PGT21_036239 [Puccinia graminis f. sp. tritici]|nr:hypothetical protein PGT21_036239 [Puccinia graminis f. sp. tritici]
MPLNAASGSTCSIRLRVDGTEARIGCQEYKHQTAINPTNRAIQEVVTIESQQASPFEILIDIKPTTYSAIIHPLAPRAPHQSLVAEDYICNIYLDGIIVACHRRPRSTAADPSRISRVFSHDYSRIRALQFAAVNLVDPDDYNGTTHDQQAGSIRNPSDKICEDETVIKSLGTIRIDVVRATLAYLPRVPVRNQPPTQTTNQMKFSERSKKARLATTAGLAQGSLATSAPPVMEWHVRTQDPNPFLQFIFNYKPRMILEAEGTIPAPPLAVAPPPPQRAPDPAPVELVELETDPSENKNQKPKKGNKRRVKVEDEDSKELKISTKKSKVIDLTGSD